MQSDDDYETGWTVDNYQIPVPLGDCSVHLLVHNGQIKKAILMDGGTSAQSVDASLQITDVLDKIDRTYKNTIWKFDSWVVTHWDKDHYAGTLSLLSPKKKTKFFRGTGFLLDLFFQDTSVYVAGYVPDESHQTGLLANPVKKAIADKKRAWREAKTGKVVKPRETALSKVLALENRLERSELCGKELIGRDLFTLNQIFDLGGTETPDPGLDPSQPLFCVVGAGGYGVTKKEKFRDSADYPTRNETSILAVLFWPRKKRISYFTGGDGNPKVEIDLMIPFLQKAIMDHAPLKVEVMKLDHHGSSRENLSFGALNDLVVTRLDPHAIIVTPGNKFGHPTFDVLAFLVWFFERKDPSERPPQDHRGLYTTRAPYWVTKADADQRDINFEHFKYIDQIHIEALAEAHFSAVDGTRELSGDMIHTQAQVKMMRTKYIRNLVDNVLRLPQNTKLNASDVKALLDKEFTDLKMALGKAIHTPSEEEPETTDYQDMLMSVDEYCDMIQDNATAEQLPEICPQDLSLATDQEPFFMLRYRFNGSGCWEIKSEKVATKIKPPKKGKGKYATPAALSNMLLHTSVNGTVANSVIRLDPNGIYRLNPEGGVDQLHEITFSDDEDSDWEAPEDEEDIGEDDEGAMNTRTSLAPNRQIHYATFQPYITNPVHNPSFPSNQYNDTQHLYHPSGAQPTYLLDRNRPTAWYPMGSDFPALEDPEKINPLLKKRHQGYWAEMGQKLYRAAADAPDGKYIRPTKPGKKVGNVPGRGLEQEWNPGQNEDLSIDSFDHVEKKLQTMAISSDIDGHNMLASALGLR